MENGSASSFYFNLSLFVNVGHYRYPAFVLCLLLFAFVVCANLVIVGVIAREPALHGSMYVFVALLCANALYGAAGFFPRFLSDILSDTHLISRPACFAQIYVVYSYAFSEVTILGVMSYDRYVAVCRPLHYHSEMTAARARRLAAAALLLPAIYLSASVYVTGTFPLCGTEIHRVYCAGWSVAKLACVPSAATQAAATTGAAAVSFLPVGCILYSYGRIVRLCWSSSAAFRGKVLQSCLPHVASVLVYCVTSFSDTVLNRLDLRGVNPAVAVLLSLELVVVPPLLNPLVYGLKLPEIRTHIVKILSLS